MKIIIVYALAGIGHRRAATALFNYLKGNYRECDVALVDSLQYSNPLFRFFYTNGYFFLVKYLPCVWKFLYYLTYEKKIRFIIKKIRRLVNSVNTKDFADYLERCNPDIVISTHLLAGEVISDLKKRNKINTRLVNVITDFNVHPFWLGDGVDEYIVALESTKQELVAMAVTEEKIKVLGIPVDSVFTKQYDKYALRQGLGLEKNKFTLLIVTGAIGIGPIEPICDALYKDAQLLVVCGSNYRLLKKLQQKAYPSLKAFGVVGNIEELMAASDIILTKPGGLTASESLSMGLPMLFIVEIPGQESKNAEVLTRYNLARIAKQVEAIRQIVLDYIDNPSKLEEMKKNIENIKKPNATKDICDEVCKGRVWPAN